MPIKLILLVALIVCPVLVSSCVKIPDASNMDAITKTGDGFYTVRANQNTDGENSYTEDFAMLRAAELARDQGYSLSWSHFVGQFGSPVKVYSGA